MSNPNCESQFKALSDICHEQEIELNLLVWRAGMYNEWKLPYTTYLANGLLAAIAVAGRELRKWPGQPLAKRSIKHTPETERLGETAKALLNMVNASREPAWLDPPGVNFRGHRALAINTCFDAEDDFSLMIDALLLGRKSYAGSQIFAVGDTPILWRKGAWVTSALSIQPITVDGIPYQAGSLFRVDTTSMLMDCTEILPPTDILQIGFMRHSAFAFDPEERIKIFAGEMQKSGEVELDILANTKISFIHQQLTRFIREHRAEQT